MKRKESVCAFAVKAATAFGEWRPRGGIARWVAGTGLALMCAGGFTAARGQQSINWTFYDGGALGKSGNATNGSVIDSSAEISGGDTTLASVKADVRSSEVYIYHSGGIQTHGANTACGSRLVLKAYNLTGQTGAVAVTVVPYVVVLDWYATPNTGFISEDGIGFSLTTYWNGNAVDTRQFQTALEGREGGKVTTPVDVMGAATMNFYDGDEVRFDMSHQVNCDNQWWETEYVRSKAWYCVSVSGNGYLSVGPRLPANGPLPVDPPSQPQVTSVGFSDASGSNVIVRGVGAFMNAPVSYAVLTATNVDLPPAAWNAVQTNRFDTNGNCSFSFPIDPWEPRRFFRLGVMPH